MTFQKPLIDFTRVKPDYTVDLETGNLALAGPGVYGFVLYLKSCCHVFNSQESHSGVGTTSSETMSASLKRRFTVEWLLCNSRDPLEYRTSSCQII